MWWTPLGERVLRGAAWELFRDGLSTVRDLVEESKSSDDPEMGFVRHRSGIRWQRPRSGYALDRYARLGLRGGLGLFALLRGEKPAHGTRIDGLGAADDRGLVVVAQVDQEPLDRHGPNPQEPRLLDRFRLLLEELVLLLRRPFPAGLEFEDERHA